MKVILNIQKDNVNTLKQEILSHSNNKLKKIYVIAGDIKESGYDIIEECLIDLKARKFIAFGIDKKNTTRKMLENVLKYTKNVFVWDNNQEVEFNGSVFVFEYGEDAHIYLTQGSLTDSMLEQDLTMYTKLTYDLIKDKNEYDGYIEALTSCIKGDFVKLTKEYIDELAEQKLIFTTKQYLHVVPSIAELLGKKEQIETVHEDDEPKELPKIDLGAMKFDLEDAFEIDLGDMAKDGANTEVETLVDTEGTEEPQVEEYSDEDVEMSAFGLDEEVLEQEEETEYVIADEAIDMEALVLESKVVKFDKDKISKDKKKVENEEKDKQAAKKINLSKVSNLIMELASKPTKGKDVNKIKVPNYIKDIIPEFFDIMEDGLLRKTDDGEYKEVNIKLEIIDVNNAMKYVDGDACLRQKVGQTYIEFESDKLTDVMYEEMDIARIIKLARDSYHIEIIPRGIEEYNLWDKLCTNSFRGSDRQYGLM